MIDRDTSRICLRVFPLVDTVCPDGIGYPAVGEASFVYLTEGKMLPSIRGTLCNNVDVTGYSVVCKQMIGGEWTCEIDR